MGLYSLIDIVEFWGILAVFHCDIVFIRQPLPNKQDHNIYAAHAIIGPCAMPWKRRLSSRHAA
jgi:hypothetical protein